MKAIYKEPTDCSYCTLMIDTWPVFESNCVECIKGRTKEVDIMEFGVGMFGNKAVVALADGTLKTVSINDLTLRKE